MTIQSTTSICPTELGGQQLVDLREQLVNDGCCGPITEMSLPAAMVTSLRGIMLDFDPDLYREGPLVPAGALASAEQLYAQVVAPMLARHPVLAKAEVRASGRGLHAIIWFNAPIEFASEAQRDRWDGTVRIVQRLLPTDPNCPGITAMTRPVGSVNGKNGAVVRTLRAGERVPPSLVEHLIRDVVANPFRAVAKLVLGTDQVSPCPNCNTPESRLQISKTHAKCYKCGKLGLDRLFGSFFKSPAKPASDN